MLPPNPSDDQPEEAFGPGDFRHPGLSEPRTKEEWREYLDYVLPPRPALLPLAVYEQLNAEERHLHNAARAAHHSALVIVRTSQMQTIHHQIRRRMMTNAFQPAGARRSIVLDGPATLGKSTLVKTFAYDFEHGLRRNHPDRFEKRYVLDGRLIDYTPVVYINIPSQATPKDLSIALAQYLAQPYRSGATKSDITRLVLENMRRVGVELVIIDDAHFMDLSLKEGKVVNDHLKHIANHTAATFIYTGVDLKHSGLFLEGTGDSRATQTAGRNTLLHITPYRVRTREEKADWVSVITAMEEALVLYKHQPGTLVSEWKYLYRRTGGNISSLAELIREAAADALLTGAERIDRTLLDTIVINEHAQSTYDAMWHEEPLPPSPEQRHNLEDEDGQAAAG
ncbi:TniB family NTP-binding protein [Streptomyces sp. HNA39]|uniref:TniB family NTP-binding protein n=1 Tax=Streptomyces sp. HNA39 TaxID=2850561 RepID=UPI00200E4C6F|nr:TniB family NTP-binding protein [Streptomyces sp. HNA39]UQA34760.1 TniB family NTP-binding protein [Streptomyces sp. HNA39]